MKEEDKEEYPGEFKDNIIKIIVLLPAIFCGILYFHPKGLKNLPRGTTLALKLMVTV